MAAADNEKAFRELVCHKFGQNVFSGKRNYSLRFSGSEKVSISVDESILLPNGKELLIEIDSGNAAKILAGQYALLNGLYDGDRSNAAFIVIHYHTDNGRDYNPQRTTKNLRAIQHFSEDSEWIEYNALHINQVRTILENSNTLNEFCSAISPNQSRQRTATPPAA